jgi:hypothetical protein
VTLGIGFLTCVFADGVEFFGGQCWRWRFFQFLFFFDQLRLRRFVE